MPVFTSVLVANRGEIACRVFGTLRRLGVRSVAVCTEADADARHVREADVAVRLDGGATPRAAYLDVDAVVGAAAAAGAEAVHPGYGFLSESPALARACERAGLVFVGPPATALELMADKLAAKRLVAAHGVPVLPGTLDGSALAPGTPPEAVVATAGDVGYPLLVKPAAGGGGKGMVVVRAPGELPAALDSARRVAAASFGDDTLLLERLVDRPRHVEVQVLADTQGHVIHLGERECTLQRRYQKVVEEAPSPALDDATRTRLGEAACEVARSVGYVGAGTVEFLVPADDPTSFWFIEMNTRLQVEHPVTELVTGLDLVELQLRVAAGEPLPLRQDDVQVTGHAVEARLYAESPERGFLPATGTVLVYDDAGVGAGPAASPLRLDSGIRAGTSVTGDFDPLLAKAVAHGADRTQALDRLDTLLGSVVVLGVETNQAFLRELLADGEVRAGRLDTGLIDRLVASRSPAAPDPVLLAAAARLVPRTASPRPGTVSGTGPWATADGWRLNAPPEPRHVVLLDEAGAEHVVAVPQDAPAPTARGAVEPGVPTTVWVAADGRASRFVALSRAERAARRRAARSAATTPDRAASGEVRAAMPGTVTAVLVDDGAGVEAGATLVVVEAMKMEHPLTAPHSGTVRLRTRPGDQVRTDQVVAVVETSPHPATGDGATATNGTSLAGAPAVVTHAPTTTPHGPAHPAAPAAHSATQGAS